MKGDLTMQAVARKMGGPPKGRTVGRKRQPQPPEIRKTLAGKFGKRLLELAENAGLDANELGAKIGKTPDMVRIYFGGRAVPHLNDWPKIARALGVNIRDLLPE
jgi:ribosome-binding protein aMBF1 (putative translation factor)